MHDLDLVVLQSGNEVYRGKDFLHLICKGHGILIKDKSYPVLSVNVQDNLKTVVISNIENIRGK